MKYKQLCKGQILVELLQILTLKSINIKFTNGDLGNIIQKTSNNSRHRKDKLAS